MGDQNVPESWHIPRRLSGETLRLLTSLPEDEIERRLRMEPAAVEGQPSDEKLLCIAAEAIDGYGNGIKPGEYESSTESAVEAYGSELCAFARAVLARWGSQTVPVPAEGEVAKMVALIREISLAWEPDACLLGNMTAGQLNRAAALLEQLSASQPLRPIPVSERLPGPGDCGVDDWLPIDTAPRDNTEILASDYDAIEIVSWGICQGEWQDWECWSDREGRIMFPTWWRPLPEHPPLPERE